MTKNLNKDQL